MADNEMEKLIAGLIRKIDGRFFGKYRGTVADNKDPEHLGRLRVEVPSVLGSGVVSGWASPCVPYGGNPNHGQFFIPEVGAGVWVEFEEGDLEFPIWTGTFWSKPGGNTELPMPCGVDGAEETEPPDPQKKRIIKTSMGHMIQLVDDEEKGMVLIKDGVNGHCVTMDGEGIKITDGKNEHSVVMVGDGIAVTDGKSKHCVEMNGDGITVTDGVNKHCVKMSGDGLTITDGKNSNAIYMKSGKIVVECDKIYLGSEGAGQSMVQGNDFKRNFDQFIQQQLNMIRTYISTHCHTGNLGAPTSPPTLPAPAPPLLPTINCEVPLSENHKI